MIEAATTTATRNAIAAAHAKRGEAVAETWAWLFGRKR